MSSKADPEQKRSGFIGRRALELDCLLMVLRVRLQLSIIGYRHMQPAHLRPRRLRSVTPKRIVSAVRRVSKLVPTASCLTQALAAQRLMARHGHMATIRIGVKPLAGSALTAHAWLLHGDSVLLGGEEGQLQAFSVLTDIHTKPAP